jgi:hypothetical protein
VRSPSDFDGLAAPESQFLKPRVNPVASKSGQIKKQKKNSEDNYYWLLCECELIYHRYFKKTTPLEMNY